MNIVRGAIFNGLKWPSGRLGDITVTGVLNLTAGEIYDYNNITIQAGGVINFIGNSATPTILATRGNLINNGTITANGIVHNGGTFTNTTPNGIAVTYSIAQEAGGAGGGGGNYFDTRIQGSAGGAASSSGFGGGGGGGALLASGGNGGTNGGNGITPSPNFYNDPPGIGGTGNSTLGNGGNAGNRSGMSGGAGGAGGGSGGGGGDGGCGGGGGGGYKGFHGRGIFIYSANFTGTGSVNVSAQNGFNGGNGSGGNDTVAGGGGGGGAGGSGGTVFLKSTIPGVTVIPFLSTGTINVSRGLGGSAGLKGTSNYAINNAANGSPGANGNNGSIIQL